MCGNTFNEAFLDAEFNDEVPVIFEATEHGE